MRVYSRMFSWYFYHMIDDNNDWCKELKPNTKNFDVKMINSPWEFQGHESHEYNIFVISCVSYKPITSNLPILKMRYEAKSLALQANISYVCHHDTNNKSVFFTYIYEFYLYYFQEEEKQHIGSHRSKSQAEIHSLNIKRNIDRIHYSKF